MNIGADLNLNFNELIQGRIENLAIASFPSAGASQKGRLIFDTTNSVLKYCDGTKWIDANITNVATPTGDGNVITSLSYDPETGVLTPVKGIAALTSHQSLAGLARQYSGSVALTQSGSEYTATISAATHGCGVLPKVSLYRYDAVNAVNEEVYMEVKVSSTGDVTLASNIAVANLSVVIVGC